MKFSTRSIRERSYEILEVAAPGDVAARVINLAIGGLVLINLLAQVLTPGLTGLGLPHVATSLEWLRRVSIGLFALEYLLRLWATPMGVPAGVRFPLLRVVVRPLALADLKTTWLIRARFSGTISLIPSIEQLPRYCCILTVLQ